MDGEWVGIGEGMGKSIEFLAWSNLILGLVQFEIGLLAFSCLQKPNVQLDLISRSKVDIGPSSIFNWTSDIILKSSSPQ